MSFAYYREEETLHVFQKVRRKIAKRMARDLARGNFNLATTEEAFKLIETKIAQCEDRLNRYLKEH